MLNLGSPSFPFVPFWIFQRHCFPLFSEVAFDTHSDSYFDLSVYVSCFALIWLSRLRGCTERRIGQSFCLIAATPQWGAADAEIKVPSGENTELKRSPFKAWNRSVYRYTCYAYCKGVLPCLFLPFRSIHLHFFQNLSRFLPCWMWLTHGSCVDLQKKIGHPAGCRFPCWLPAEYK